MRTITNRNPILILCVLFVLSILFRWPNFDRPLSKHHEFNAALVLIPMDVWESSSISEFHYAPVMTYQNKGDKGINNMTFEDMHVNGDYYYLSFPVMTYIVPYVFFKIFSLEISPASLQFFNVFLHFISVLFLFKLVTLISKDRIGEERAKGAALIAGIVFLFSPTSMWFFGNGYTHHVLATTFILISTFNWISYLKTRKSLFLFLLGLTLFLAVSTAWIGVLLAVIISFYGIVLWLREKKFSHLVWLPIVSVLLALGFMFWHYSEIVGSDTFLHYLENRFLTRSLVDDGGSGWGQWLMAITKWYVVGYALLPIFMVTLVVYYFKRKIKLSKIEYWGIGALFFTAWIHHVALGEFTIAHNYSVLVDSLYLSVLIGILMMDVLSVVQRKAWLKVMFAVCIGMSVVQYYYINRPGEMSQSGEPYVAMKHLGLEIQEKSMGEETLFTVNLNEKPAPQVMYYAKRNFIQVNSFDEALKLFETKELEQGKVFFIDDEMNIVEVRRLFNDGLKDRIW